jgi:hypothetical protein
MVDYAYVPTKKGDGFMLDAKGFLELRTPALSFGPLGLGNLQDILKWVDDKAQAQRPSAVIIVSHAWPHAMSIPFVPKQKGQSTYTKLVDLQPPSTAFKLPPRFAQPPSGGQPRTTLIVKGCRIGKSEPYMRLLKTLLGGEVEVRAAQHYEYFINIDKIFVDFLAYSLEIHRKAPIAGHQALVNEFTSAGFNRYDNSPLPAADIEAALDQFLGPKFGGRKKLKPEQYLPGTTSKANDVLEVPIQANLQFPAGSVLKFEKILGPKRVLRYKKFHYEAERVEWDEIPDTGTSTKPTQAEIRTLVEKRQKEWEDQYGEVSVTGGGTVKKTYCEYLGLHPGEGLFDRIDWQLRKTKTGFSLVAVYYRYEFDMPVASVFDGTLFFTGRKRSSTQIDEQLNWPSGQDFEALFRTV